MKYEVFKEKVLREFKAYLPEAFKDWSLSVHKVDKVNLQEEALHISPPEGPCMTPTLYLGKYYRQYEEGWPFETVLIGAAAEFMAGIEYLARMGTTLSFDNPQGKVIFALVNTERNLHMLETLPHRQLLDLSVIYRFVIETPGVGIDSAIIDDHLAEELGLTEEELYAQAARNTPEIMPILIGNVGGGLCMLGNQKGFHGAAVMLYEGALDQAAEKLGTDLYIIPSSIHEVVAVPAPLYDGEGLKQTIYHVNRTMMEEKDVLSDQLYFYSKEERKLKFAELERAVS